MTLIPTPHKNIAKRNSFSAKIVFYALAVFAASITTVTTGLVTPALAAVHAVTAPSAPTFASNTSGQEPGDFVISNFDASATLSVSIGFVDPPSGTSFALPTTTGLTAGSGYNFTGNKTQITFTGTQANANTALAAMTVTTGTSTGNVTIRVTASVDRANTYYNPINGNYYEYFSGPVYAWSTTESQSAFHLAETKTLYGVTGYLATITTAQEQKFIYENFPNSNIFIGATDDYEVLNTRCTGAGWSNFANQAAAEGRWYWVSGPASEKCKEFWRGETSSGLWIKDSDGTTQARESGNVSTSRYENWCNGNESPYTLTAGRSMGEPNNYGGNEQFALEKWNGATCWNDWGIKNSYQNAYLVEYSGSFSGSSSATATVTGVVDVLSPTFSATTTLTNSGGPYTFTVTFGVAVSGVANEDFEDAGSGSSCTYSVTAVSTTVYTLTASSCFVGSAAGTVIPRFKANGATRADGVNTNTGPISAVTSTTTVTRDLTAPTVSSFTSTTSNGSYRALQSVNVAATMSENVQSGNTIVVTLDTGATVTLTAASAGTSLTGTYTVAAGHTSADLTVSSFTIGTVADTAGNAMTSTTLPTGANNIAGASQIVIDTTAPSAIGVPNLDASSDSGVSNTDDNTSDTTPTLTVDVTALEAGATGTIKATKAGSADVSCNLTAGTCTLGTLANGIWSIVSFQTDAAGNVGSDSSALSVTIDSIAPTSAILAASSATATSATITFTVTGSERLDCTSLSTAAGTDFLLTAGISSLTSIAQTSNTVCTISATSTAVAGGSTVSSTLTVATSFSVSDPAGNARTTLTGSPQSISVTVPANSSGSTPGTTTTTTVTTTTTIAPSPTTTAPSRVTAPAPSPSQPRVTVPGAPLPRKVVVLTPVAKDDPTAIVADLVRQLAADGNTQAANKVRSAVIAAAPAIGQAIADATERLANVLQDKSSTNLDIIRAKAAVADAASLITLTALRTTNGNVQSLALPITRNNVLPEVEPGDSVIINSEGAQPAQLRVVKGTTLVLTSGQENLSLAMSAIQSDGRPSPISTRGTVRIAQGQNLAVTGSGFKPNSKVAVWIFSSPRSFGSVITDANGSFAAEIPMPDNVAPGNHTAQVNGQRKNGDIRSLNLGLEVILEEARATIGNPTQSITRKMSARIKFNAHSFVLTKTTQKQLIRLAQQLQKVSTISVRCVGYTQEGIVSDRYELAQNRADAVCQRLRKLGVNAKFDAVGLGRAKVTTAAARHVQLTITFASTSIK